MDELEQNQENMLNSALDSMPLMPLPAGFVDRVMTRVQATAVAHTTSEPIRFRLQFIDFALALFWAVILSFIWLGGLWWKGIIMVAWLPPLNTELPGLNQLTLINNPFVVAGICVLILEICLIALISVNVLQEQI